MNKYFVSYKQFILVFVFFGLCGAAAFGQTKEESLRKVKKQILTSTGSPEIRLKFDKKFKFAGSNEFVLYGRANAEQYFFVESENKKIKRLYMLQFERFLPGAEGTYNYDEPQSLKIEGLDYIANIESVPNVEAALKAVPDSDIAKAAAFLQGKGFKLMNSLIYQRFVRVVSADKRREFIILYVEDAEGNNAETQGKTLQKNALSQFRVL
jgi:hypothetical protein